MTVPTAQCTSEWDCAKRARRVRRRAKQSREPRSDSTGGRASSFNYSKSVRFFPRLNLKDLCAHRTIRLFLPLVLSVQRLEIFVWRWPTPVRCAFAYDLKHFRDAFKCNFISIRLDAGCWVCKVACDGGLYVPVYGFSYQIMCHFSLIIRSTHSLLLLHILLSVPTGCTMQFNTNRCIAVEHFGAYSRRTCEYLTLIHPHYLLR